MRGDNRSELQEIEYSRSGKPMKRCAICREWIRLDRMREHVRARHNSPRHSGSRITICGACGKEVPRGEYDSHICTRRGNAYILGGAPGLGRKR